MKGAPPEPAVPVEGVASELLSAARRLDLRARARELDRAPAFPRAEFRELGRLRLLGLRTPARSGGRARPLPEVGAALFHLARECGTAFPKLVLQPEFCGVLEERGSPDLRERYFRRLMRGELLIGNQITEPSAGSDARALRMTAEPDGDGYRLTGTKTEAAFAADADAAIVYARTPPSGDRHDGLTAFLVPQDLPGITRRAGEDLGERWMRRGEVRYERVAVPAGLRIGEEGEGFTYLREELLRERLLLAAIYLGVGRASWEETVRDVGARQAFGAPLAAQEAVSFPLVEDWARLDATWGYVERGLHRLESGADVGAEASLAKWMAVEVALTAIDHAIQFHGGRGYSRELPHEQRWRDVRSGSIAHGPSEVMRLVAARALWPREAAPVPPEPGRRDAPRRPRPR